MGLASGAKLGRYEIRSKLGEGGMGEVYLARDTELDREVALKILPADVASRQDRMRRFVQEAKSAAALNHPNIAHVYEIGEHDGVNFIAMEFVDGVTLREKIHREQTDLSSLLLWEEGFFNSRFTHPSGIGKLTTHQGGFIGLWTELVGKQEFPIQYLARSTQTIEQFIESVFPSQTPEAAIARQKSQQTAKEIADKEKEAAAAEASSDVFYLMLAVFGILFVLSLTMVRSFHLVFLGLLY